MTDATQQNFDEKLHASTISYIRKLRATVFACTYPGAHPGVIRQLRVLITDGKSLEAQVNQMFDINAESEYYSREDVAEIRVTLSITEAFNAAIQDLHSGLREDHDMDLFHKAIFAARNAAEDAIWALDNEVLYRKG
jgi:hypothetical protein